MTYDYNFLNGNIPFSIYLPTIPVEETNLKMPLGEKDISDWGTVIGDIPMAKPIVVLSNNFQEEEQPLYEEPINNSSKFIVNNNPEYNGMSEYNTTIVEEPISTTYKVNSNIKGNKKHAFDFFLKRIYNIHKSKGLDDKDAYKLSLNLAAGIVGNLMLESSLNHNIVNKSSGAYGLALWLGSRKKALFKKYGNNPTFDLQLDFIWEELNGTERSAFLHLLTTKSYEDSVRSVMNRFERPSQKEKNESIRNRLNFAKSLLS